MGKEKSCSSHHQTVQMVSQQGKARQYNNNCRKVVSKRLIFGLGICAVLLIQKYPLVNLDRKLWKITILNG